LHDDVVDGSQLRRGKVAAHLIWGAAQSVLVGDFLFARAFELMVETNSMKALEILARASRVIAEGEVLQLTRSHDLNLSQASIWRSSPPRPPSCSPPPPRPARSRPGSTPPSPTPCAPTA
jgi:geranylgeranyl pyrophosphate synthase